MASERLTISEKDRIARNIIKPIVEQSRKESEKFGKFADEYFKKILPKDVVEFMDKYPNTVNIREEIYLSSLTNERFRYLKTYIEVNYFVYSLITNLKTISRKHTISLWDFPKKVSRETNVTI